MSTSRDSQSPRLPGEEALRAKTEELDRYFANSLDLLCVAGLGGHFHRLNPEWERILGYPLAELEGRRFLEFVHPDDLQVSTAALEKLSSQDVIDFVSRYRHRDGSYRCIEWRFHVSESRIYVAGRDITERRRADVALRENEEKFRALAEGALVGVVIIQDGRFKYVNAAMAEMLGYSPEDMLAAPSVLELVAEEDRAMVRENVRRRQEGEEESIRYTFRALKQDGSWADLEVFGSRISFAGRSAVMSTVMDTTERKRAEAALRQSELKYRRLHETMTDAFVLVDMAGRILESNQAYRDMLGYTETEICRLTFQDLTPGKWHAFEARIVQEQILPRGFSGVYEKEYRRKGGSVFPVELRVSLVSDDAGQPAAMSAIVRDVTERKRAEAAMLELSARLLAVQDEERRHLARELHDTTAQHVAALVLNLTALRNLPPKAATRAEKLRADSLALADRVGQEIRTLAYLLHPPLLEAVGLAGAARDYVHGFARRSGIEVAVNVSGDFGRLPPAAELALFRVVQESLGNVARHASSPTATIRLARAGHFAKVEVQDRGRGIPAEKLILINEMRGALGVGIAGMRERLRQLAGELEIESGPQGTTVRATLPLTGEEP